MVIEKKLFSIRSPFFLSSVVNAFRCFFDELWFFYCYCVCKIALAYETPKQRDNTSAKSNQQSPNALGQRSILVWIFVLKLLRTPLPANVKIPSKGRRNKRGPEDVQQMCVHCPPYPALSKDEAERPKEKKCSFESAPQHLSSLILRSFSCLKDSGVVEVFGGVIVVFRPSIDPAGLDSTEEAENQPQSFEDETAADDEEEEV